MSIPSKAGKVLYKQGGEVTVGDLMLAEGAPIYDKHLHSREGRIVQSFHPRRHHHCQQRDCIKLCEWIRDSAFDLLGSMH